MDANNKKTIALIAHDNRKKEMIEWVDWNSEALLKNNIICTGTTGKLIRDTLEKSLEKGEEEKYNITLLKSGPLGGDQQMGAMIVNGQIDMMVFFWDPMQQLAHDVDVKALLRITVLYNIPTACNRSTADFLISSELFAKPYVPKPMDVNDYLNRPLDV